MVLKNKIIVVTGGSGLLGSAYIKDIISKGGTVINLDIENGKLGEFIQCDTTSEEEINKTIITIQQKFGGIHGWVNNAYPRTNDWGKKLEDIPLESWKKNVDLQLNGYFVCSRAICEFMKKNQGGSVVNLASIYGMVAPDFSVYEGTEMTMPAAYSAIKAGIINLTRYMAVYYAEHKIRVNAVSPGGIFNHQPESFVKSYEKKVPMKRMGTPGDIAPVISFLLSDEAGYVTGQNIAVDGGWTSI